MSLEHSPHARAILVLVVWFTRAYVLGAEHATNPGVRIHHDYGNRADGQFVKNRYSKILGTDAVLPLDPVPQRVPWERRQL